MKFLKQIHIINEKDIHSIYKQNASEYGGQDIRKGYSIAGLEDPLKEIKTDYNHN